jgi:hypothetical protein
LVWVKRKRAFNDVVTIKRHVREERTQLNHATLLSSRYMSSQPTSESGIDRIWETRMQKWVRCNVPPMRQADVFGASSGTLFRKIGISNAIRDGKAVILAHKSQLDSHERGCPRWIAETSVVVIVSFIRIGSGYEIYINEERRTPDGRYIPLAIPVPARRRKEEKI